MERAYLVGWGESVRRNNTRVMRTQQQRGEQGKGLPCGLGGIVFATTTQGRE
jgi:hypothetical protein